MSSHQTLNTQLGVKGRASPPPPRESYHANPSNSKNAREALAAPTPMRHDLEGADAERQVASRSVSPPPSASPMDGGGAAAGVAVVEKSGREDRLSDLPDDLVCKMLRFLDIDSVVHCGMLSTRWPGLLDEKLYRVLCERVYLDQAHVKTLNLQRFQTWRNMLLLRPRVRLNGLYVLESRYIKRIVRDMWTETPPNTILEVKYWRYLRFLPQNRLMYACTPAHPPQDAVNRLFKEGGARFKEVCGGHYMVHRGEVHCQVQTSYAVIKFRLEIAHGQRGHWCQLLLKEHCSIPLTDPTGTPIPHLITSFEAFHFRRVPSF